MQLPRLFRRPGLGRSSPPRTGTAPEAAGHPTAIFTRRVFVRFLGITLAIGLVGALAARLAPAAPAFDPTGPCVADGTSHGAYPQLEARLPASLDGRKPDDLDSGRNCTDKNLATLVSHGIHEVRFAGGLWSYGQDKGVRLAVFSAAGLTSDFMSEWFEAGAQAAPKTQNLTTAHPTVNGRPGYRLDTINGDSQQTVIVWPSADRSVVQVVLAADVPEDTIQAAIKAFG